MRLRHALIVALAGSALCAPAVAAEQPAAETPVATATASPSVAEQIDAYLRSSPAAELPDAGAPEGVVSSTPDRRVHGEVAVGIGTHGYRSIYMRSDMPIGDSGMLSVAVQDTRGGGRFGRYGGQDLGIGLAFGGAANTLGSGHRCDLEAMTPPRPLDSMGGPNGRCAGRLRGP